MANLVSIIGCKSDKETRSCNKCMFGKKWDGKRCIQYMRTNKMQEILEDCHVSFSQSY